MSETEPRVVVSRSVVGLCYMQVCAAPDATDEEILEVCNRENPSGTERGWTSVIRAGEGAPVPCKFSSPRRTHFLAVC